MSNIVVITMPGATKRVFVNTLNERTGGGVVLTVVQTPKKRSLLTRVLKFYNKVGLAGLPTELYYFSRMALSKGRRQALGYTKSWTPPETLSPGFPNTLTTDNVNSNEVYEAVKHIAPDLIVIWGGLIVSERIFGLAPYALNMHAGYCPYYRGTNCNLHALLKQDMEHVGTTIHAVVSKVDAGGIYKIVTADTNQKPTIFFQQLNDASVEAYIEIILRIANGETLPTTPQNLSLGRNYMLKDWTYEKQFRAANALLVLQRRHS